MIERTRRYRGTARLTGGIRLVFILLAAAGLSLIQPYAQAEGLGFPYKLDWRDCVLMPLGAAAMTLPKIIVDADDQFLTVDEIAALDEDDVNAFDRGAVDNWNREADAYGNVLAAAMPYLPAALALSPAVRDEWKHAAAIGAMYLEVYLLTKGVTNLAKAVFPRNRPFAYNAEYSAQERYEFQGDEAPEGKSSFFSGHASAAFASAVFLSKVYSDLYGKTALSYAIWGTSLSLAAFTAYSRVLSGEHFLSDALMGAAVGSAVGYLVPVLHKPGSEKAAVSVLPGSVVLVYRY